MMWANCLECVSGAVPVSVVTEQEADFDSYDSGPYKGVRGQGHAGEYWQRRSPRWLQILHPGRRSLCWGDEEVEKGANFHRTCPRGWALGCPQQGCRGMDPKDGATFHHIL